MGKGRGKKNPKLLPWTNLSRFCIGKKKGKIFEIEDYMGSIHIVGRENLALFNKIWVCGRMTFSHISIKIAEATLEMWGRNKTVTFQWSKHTFSYTLQGLYIISSSANHCFISFFYLSPLKTDLLRVHNSSKDDHH